MRKEMDVNIAGVLAFLILFVVVMGLMAYQPAPELPPEQPPFEPPVEPPVPPELPEPKDNFAMLWYTCESWKNPEPGVACHLLCKGNMQNTGNAAGKALITFRGINRQTGRASYEFTVETLDMAPGESGGFFFDSSGGNLECPDMSLVDWEIDWAVLSG